VDEGLKKRLLGAAVLASLAVIFVPMLIEEPPVNRQELREIPPPPERKDFASSMLREEVARPQPVRVDIPPVTPTSVVGAAEPAQAVVALPEPEPAPEPQPVPPEPEPEQEQPQEQEQQQEPTAGTPAPDVATRTGLTAWVVQVGSFSNRDNANRLIVKLREAGFQAADAEQVDLRGEMHYRVRVGPMIEKAKAERLLPEIDKVSGTNGRVMRFQ
jgi:DedD protein